MERDAFDSKKTDAILKEHDRFNIYVNNYSYLIKMNDLNDFKTCFRNYKVFYKSVEFLSNFTHDKNIILRALKETLDSKKLKEVQERLDEIRDAGTEASFAFKDMSQQIGQIAKNSGDLRDSIIASGKAAKDLVKESNELAKFTTADLSDKKQAAKFETHSMNLAKKRAKIESQIRVLNV